MKPDSKKSRKRPAKKARKKTQKNMWKEGNITGKVVSNEKAKTVARQLKTLQILDFLGFLAFHRRVNFSI